MANTGFAFERSFCKRLTLWWTGDESADVVFWRTAGSGARATTRRRAGKKSAASHCGDLAAIDPSGEPLTRLITFELKSGYKADTLHDLLDRPANATVQEYEEWIEKARTAATNAGTPFWVIVHWRKRREITITMPGPLADVLDLETLAGPIQTTRYIVPGTGKRRRIVSLPVEIFFDVVRPVEIRKLLFDRGDRPELAHGA